MKIIVVILFVAIIISLSSGLWFLSKDDQGSTRVLTALKIRVALSAALILFLIVSYYQGWLQSAG